jgi:hypothetical protein
MVLVVFGLSGFVVSSCAVPGGGETSNAVSWFGKFAELLRVFVCRFGCGACVAGFILIALGASVCVVFVGLSRLDLFCAKFELSR